jgi:hypothetical protein
MIRAKHDALQPQPAMSVPAASPMAGIAGTIPGPVSSASMDARADALETPAAGDWAGQKLIRSADVRIQVRDAAIAARQADDVARMHGGLVADSHITQGDRSPTDASFVIRVPADSFDAAIADVRRLGRVRSENTSIGDVTRQSTDLETRLAVKEQTAAQLRDLLAHRTGKLSDVLEVERELARVATELEQMRAQRREYDHQVAVSTITVSLFEPTSEGLAALERSLQDSLRQMTDVLASSVGTVVYLVTFLVPWVILAAAGWWCVRTIRRAS